MYDKRKLSHTTSTPIGFVKRRIILSVGKIVGCFDILMSWSELKEIEYLRESMIVDWPPNFIAISFYGHYFESHVVRINAPTSNVCGTCIGNLPQMQFRLICFVFYFFSLASLASLAFEEIFALLKLVNRGILAETLGFKENILSCMNTCKRKNHNFFEIFGG